MAVAKRIDDRIERVARQVLHTECAVLGTNTTTDDDDDLSTPDRNDTVTTLTVSTGIYNKEGGQQERTSGNDVSGNLLEEMRDVIGPVPTMKKIKSFAKELVLTSGEYFFPEDTTLKSEGNTYTNDNANATNAKDNNSNNTIIEDYDDGSSVESATLAPFETSEQNRIRIRIRTGSRTRTLDSCDDDAESWKKKRDDDNRTYSTAGSLSFESTLNESTVLSGDKFDIDDDDDDNSNDVGVADDVTHVTEDEETKTIDSYEVSAASGCSEDEESTPRDRTSLMDEVVDEHEDQHDNEDQHEHEQQLQAPSKTKQQQLQRGNNNSNSNNNYHSSKGEDKPNLPSVVENIAEVLSNQPCGFFVGANANTNSSEIELGVEAHGVPNGVWNRNHSRHNNHNHNHNHNNSDVPQSIDPFSSDDMLSVGELTAITLEKNERRERNRMLLVSRFLGGGGFPTEVFSRGGKVAAAASGGTTTTTTTTTTPLPSSVLNHRGAKRASKWRFVPGNGGVPAGAGASEQQRGANYNGNGGASENYFAEYEDGVADGVTSIYDTSRRSAATTTTTTTITSATSTTTNKPNKEQQQKVK
mmetsp:Transcript_3039/g.5368  ORF Transcript_3039/g.5368 Transcript_3039/m.5368 type:complete len:584 (+) Transcript_3039:584-2335(+)